VPDHLQQIPGRPANKELHTFPEFNDGESLDMLDRFGEKFRLAGIECNPSGFHELQVFDVFLADHVQPDRISSVQCMLLWSEWVRTFQDQVPGFPNVIHEKEFRTVIMDKFGVEIANDDERGKIYTGLRFVP
jgi:hypothetical protein